MATLQEISSEDFNAFKNNSIASKEYYSLAEDKQKKYEIDYTSKFSEEFKKLRSQIMDSEQIDLKTAGQILLREIRNAHFQGNFFMDASGNIDRDKFNQIRTTIVRDIKSGKHDILLQKNQKEKITNQKEKENNNPLEQKIDEIKNSLNNYNTLSDEEKQVARKNLIHELSQMSEEDRNQAYNELGVRTRRKKTI